jgi:hypothetical protein
VNVKRLIALGSCHSDTMGGVDFEAVMKVSAFVMSLYIAGILCKKFSVSPVIGEMIVGVLLGPNSPWTGMQDFIPFPSFWTLAGNFGVTLMIFESGMHLNFEMIKQVGGKAMVVAILGTFLPIGAGVGVMAAYNYELWPQGLAVGVALAPTSVGMALKMLGEKKQLGELFGQALPMPATDRLSSRPRAHPSRRPPAPSTFCATPSLPAPPPLPLPSSPLLSLSLSLSAHRHRGLHRRHLLPRRADHARPDRAGAAIGRGPLDLGRLCAAPLLDPLLRRRRHPRAPRRPHRMASVEAHLALLGGLLAALPAALPRAAHRHLRPRRDGVRAI